ncbi:type VI immunity family protein [Variovorax sp. H27-G14]|uniref:type VI immunity family protein n=1 Tax=Variovorax sp. H27-G14 TaxID=3111914 RepID=UPI0038FC9681
MTPPPPAPDSAPALAHSLAQALAVLNNLSPEAIDRLRRPMGVLMFRLGKLLCAAKAPTLPLAALLQQDLAASLRLYPDLKRLEPGLREALGVLTQVLAGLGGHIANPPAHKEADHDADDTWGRPLPDLPLYRAIGAFALAFPVRTDSRRYEMQPGEESVVHANGNDKPKLREDAQRSFATLLDACDYQAGGWRAPFTSEPAYAANGMPFIDAPLPRPVRRGDCYWRKPRGGTSPDFVVVPPNAPAPRAAQVMHAVELKFAQDALGLRQSQRLADLFGRDRLHVLYLPGPDSMHGHDALPAADLQRWTDALRHDPNATVTVPAGPAGSPLQTPATWRLGMFASACFYVHSRADAARLAVVVPRLHQEFQALTGQALTRYMALRSGAVSRKAYTQEDIDAHCLKHADDMVCIHGFDAPTKESASCFEFQAVVQFCRARQPRPSPELDYLALQFPLAFWSAHKHELRAWWLSALQRLHAVQARMGLGMGRPPVLERHPLQEPAEFALARCFLGLDIDKPFFMRDAMGLEGGIRTPGFAVLLSSDQAQRLGGMPTLSGALRKMPGLRLHPCGNGLWVEAGHAPALHPVEQGVPAALRALAEALKPVRAQRPWLVSYPPNEARDDIFTPATAAQWLRRFDADVDANIDANIDAGKAPTARPSASPAAG